MTNLSENLKQSGLKVTPQRLAIYNMLVNTTAHPTAETIYNSLKELYPSMSLATVYKTVASLKQAKLVQELSIDEQSSRYDANTEFHPHLICSCCNEVFDYFCSDLLQKIKTDIKAEMGFDIHSEQVYFYGICKNCKDSKLS